MAVNLVTRIEKLETKASSTSRSQPKLVRMVTTKEEEAEVYRLAKEMGLDTGPNSNDVFVISLVPLATKEPHLHVVSAN